MKQYDIRCLFVDVTAAHNGGSKEQYWSVGYWAEGMERSEEAWNEVAHFAAGEFPKAERLERLLRKGW